MSLSSCHELLFGASKHYALAKSAERLLILDQFVASTGYDRNYAINLLLHPVLSPKVKPARKPRTRAYGVEVQKALEALWEVAGGICGKRLVPMLPILIEALERHQEMALTPRVRGSLLKMSAATCDRLLTTARTKQLHGLCTTKPTPHLLLRSQIPVHTFSDWNEPKVGFMEVDLVAHCGEANRDAYLLTMTAVDVASGWTRCNPLPNKGMIEITKAMDKLRGQLPFTLLGIDTDNGGEFINYNLVRYCVAANVTMTRCRPYKKNDQCHVEQKNGNIVRGMAGYGRLEGEHTLAMLTKLYNILDLYQNFFQPSMKLLHKQRDGAKVTKTYDEAQTPYQRLLASDHVTEEQKTLLRQRFDKLNPAALHRNIASLRSQIRKAAADYTPEMDVLADLCGIKVPTAEAEDTETLLGPVARCTPELNRV